MRISKYARSVLAAAIIAGTSCGFATLASAADQLLYQAPPAAQATLYHWTGAYFGTHVGYGRSHNDYSSQFVRPNGIADPKLFGGAGGSGGLGGIQAGLNWQTGNVVFGIEGDLARTSINADTTVDLDLTYKSRNRWLASATGRIGFAFDNLLIYAKGGAAFTGASTIVTVEGVPLEGHSTATGWTLGGGFEYGLDPNWSFKLEYAYFRFDEEAYASYFPPGNGTVNHTLSERIGTVKFGINYRFGVGKAPVAVKY